MTNNIVYNINFTVLMMLFTCCIYGIIANISKFCASGLINLMLSLMHENLLEIWPHIQATSVDPIGTYFWNLLKLPQYQRQYCIIHNHNLPNNDTSPNFTIYNISDVIHLQLNDSLYLAGLKKRYYDDTTKSKQHFA